LSEISHFGTFQRVGGKAGGFINKKFFHPSSFRNQEKLWKAQTEDERQRRKQMEMEKRREEERQVEDLKKQMYLAGQGKASDFVTTSSVEDTKAKLTGGDRSEQIAYFEEQKRRKAMLKRERAERNAAAADEGDEDSEDEEEDELGPESGERILAKSSYKEDVFVLGHSAIWGSWYSTDEKQWGFGCCKTMRPTEQCPLAEVEDPGAMAQEQPKGRKRRRGGGKAGAVATDVAGEQNNGMTRSVGDAARPSDTDGPTAPVGPSAGSGDQALMDSRLLEAAERRQKQKREEAKLQADAKVAGATSGYLADLLQDPSAT